MFIGGMAIHHFVDTTTKFSSATFLDPDGETYDQTVEGIWLALVMTWAILYTEFPDQLRTDQGSVISSDR